MLQITHRSAVLTALTTEEQARVVGVFTITDEEFQAFRTLVLKEAGIFLSDAKRQLVSSRLAKRLRHFGFTTFSQYYHYLKTQDLHGEERMQMVNCLTTNKTDFFREPHHFDFLREQVLPKLRDRTLQGGAKRLRIWSAGCSSGEEPYTIALTVREALDSLTGWDVKILASDIDTKILRQAETGIYATERIEGMSERLRRKYFLRGKGRWSGFVRVRPDLRKLIAFRRINLIEEPWPIRARFDVIFCRNVIIYFNRDTQQRLFERLAGYLHDDGYLMVGHSENLHWLSDLFVPLRSTIYRLRSARKEP